MVDGDESKVIHSYSSNNAVKKKMDKLIATKMHNDPSFARLVDYVAPSVETIDIHSERRLMRKMEHRELELNKVYLSEFETVNAHVQEFANKVNDMHKICADLTKEIQENKEKTQDLLSKTSTLQHRKKVVELKQKAINDFLSKFSLTPAEEAALLGNPTDGTISSEFFTALERARQIYEESKNLLRASANHVAAMGVMEEMSKKMEAAYDVLYRSIQRECRILNTEMLEIRGLLSESFAALKDRQVLLKYALDDYGNARKNHVTRAFSDALTRGVGGSSKPIEMLSHDPLRYTGDMLAWMLECIENEKELLTLLLNKCSPEVLYEHEQRVLSLVSSQLARSFKVRMEQTLTGEHDSSLLYRLVSLLAFYASKLLPLLGAESELEQTLEEVQQLTLNIFFSGLGHIVQKIVSKMGTPDYDLLPVQAVHQTLVLLKDVLDTHDSSVSSGDESRTRFDRIVGTVVDPLIRSTQLTAAQLHSVIDVAVYTINCLSSIHSLLILYPFTEKRLEIISALMEGHEDTLISEGASSLLSSTSLLSLYHKAHAHFHQQGPLSQIAEADISTVKRALSAFDSFLAQPQKGRMDEVARISNARVRERVERRTLDNVVAAYAVIHEKIVDPFNRYEELTDVKTPEQVRELLK